METNLNGSKPKKKGKKDMETSTEKFTNSGKEIVANMGSKMSELYSQASHELDHFGEGVSKLEERAYDSYKGAARNIEAGVKRHPIRSVLIATGVGLVAGSLFKLKSGRGQK